MIDPLQIAQRHQALPPPSSSSNMPLVTAVDLTGDLPTEVLVNLPSRNDTRNPEPSNMPHQLAQPKPTTPEESEPCSICTSPVPGATVQCNQCSKRTHLSRGTAYAVNLNIAPSEDIVTYASSRDTVCICCPLCRALQCKVPRCRKGVKERDKIEKRVNAETRRSLVAEKARRL